MKIIRFYEEFGEKATKALFGARRLISSWRERLKESGGQPSSLVPYSTRPHRVSTSDSEFYKRAKGRNIPHLVRKNSSLS